MIRFSFCIFYNINWTNLSLKFWTVMIIVLCIWLLYMLRQTTMNHIELLCTELLYFLYLCWFGSLLFNCGNMCYVLNCYVNTNWYWCYLRNFYDSCASTEQLFYAKLILKLCIELLLLFFHVP
jgi:hypothetical protein